MKSQTPSDPTLDFSKGCLDLYTPGGHLRCRAMSSAFTIVATSSHRNFVIRQTSQQTKFGSLVENVIWRLLINLPDLGIHFEKSAQTVPRGTDFDNKKRDRQKVWRKMQNVTKP